jgi:hypothetical protein
MHLRSVSLPAAPGLNLEDIYGTAHEPPLHAVPEVAALHSDHT